MNTTYNKALADRLLRSMSDYKASHEFFIQECFEEWLHKMVEIGYYLQCNIK